LYVSGLSGAFQYDSNTKTLTTTDQAEIRTHGLKIRYLEGYTAAWVDAINRDLFNARMNGTKSREHLDAKKKQPLVLSGVDAADFKRNVIEKSGGTIKRGTYE
jgi:hypothetical protein